MPHFLQRVGHDLSGRGDVGNVGADQHHDLLASVPGFREVFLHRGGRNASSTPPDPRRSPTASPPAATPSRSANRCLSSPATACITSVWLNAPSSARTHLRLVEGWLGVIEHERRHLAERDRSSRSRGPCCFAIAGSRSKIGRSHQSISPDISAAIAGRRIGHDVPLDAIHVDDLSGPPSGTPFRRRAAGRRRSSRRPRGHREPARPPRSGTARCRRPPSTGS